MQTPQEATTLSEAVLHEEQWLGEWRVNWIRTAALIALYGQHFVHAVVLKDPTITPEFHRNISLICAGWLLAILAVHYCLWRRWMPPYLKYGATLWDLAMCGLVLSAGDGPRSSLLILLPVVVASASVRLSRGLVWFATLGAMICYLCILANYAWFKVGFKTYYATPELRIPRVNQIIMLVTIGVAGLLAGQAVRQVHRVLKIGIKA